jgi:hypothetical protein
MSLFTREFRLHALRSIALSRLIAGLVKLERMRLHLIGATLKLRLRAIAKKAGMDEPKLTTLIEQTNEATDRYPIPGVNNEALAVVA